MQKAKTPEGLERVAETSGKTARSTEGGAESGALGAQIVGHEPVLSAIIEAWPTLPGATKMQILATIRSSGERDGVIGKQ